MKVFFTAPVRGKKFHQDYYSKIYSALESLGCVLIDKYLLENTIENHYKNLEQEIDQKKNDFFYETLDNLKLADVNIFDGSLPSLGVGFLVQKSLEINKPTIVLYLKGQTPHFLMSAKDEKLIIKSTTGKDLKKVLREALDEAKTRADKRFNFFISPKLLEYLEKVSKEEAITKSKFIRNLILEHMRKSS